MAVAYRVDIEAANRRAARAMIEADPVWVDVRAAIDVVPGMTERLVLHSGPPVTWERMLDGQKGAVICALLAEGLADTPEQAERLVAQGEVQLGSAHDHQATGPGSGPISAHMPVFVVRDAATGLEGYCTLPELNMVFGRYDRDAVDGVKWLRDELGPLLKEAVTAIGGLAVKPLAAKGLIMGDEGHDRSVATSYLLAAQLAPALLRAQAIEREAIARLFEYVARTELFFFTFLNMAASKVITRAAEGIEGSSVVTVLAGNGTDYGIKVSGLGDQWFTGPAPVITAGVFFGNYTQVDCAPEQGDSVVCETAGLGGFALPASPAHVRACGASMEDALRYTREMWEITVDRNPAYEIPALDFQGAPTGIDVRKVIQTGITPLHAAGLGHRQRGIGFIALGLGYAPKEPFQAAMTAFEQRYGAS